MTVKAAARSDRSPAPWRRSIRAQLIVSNILALTVLLGAFGVVVRVTVRATMMASVDRELDSRVSYLVDGAGPHHGHGMGHGLDDDDFGHGGFGDDGPPGDGPPGDHDFGDEHGPSIHNQDPYSLRLFDASGISTAPVSIQTKIWDLDALTAAKSGAITRSTVVSNGVTVRVLTRPFPATGRLRGIVEAPYALTDVNRAIGWLDRTLLLLSPVALLFAGAGGAFLTRRMLRRVHAMATAADLIGAEDLSSRLPATGDDEFSHLARTFNGLLGRVESAFRAQERLTDLQRRFTADASHELKTPLTTIKGTASMALYTPMTEEMYKQSMVEIDRAAGSMSRLVQDLLLLARADNAQVTETTAPHRDDAIELTLREVLARALPTRLPNVPTPPVTLRLSDETLTVVGAENELVRLFRNLIENAVRSTPPEGKVTVSADRVDGNAVVTIADTGSGIAPEHLPHLGERFYRTDASRARPDGGTGLGISISKSIAESHGGGIAFTSEVGVGTTVRVTLPAAG